VKTISIKLGDELLTKIKSMTPAGGDRSSTIRSLLGEAIAGRKGDDDQADTRVLLELVRAETWVYCEMLRSVAQGDRVAVHAGVLRRCVPVEPDVLAVALGNLIESGHLTAAQRVGDVEVSEVDRELALGGVVYVGLGKRR